MILRFSGYSRRYLVNPIILRILILTMEQAAPPWGSGFSDIPQTHQRSRLTRGSASAAATLTPNNTAPLMSSARGAP